MTIIVEDSLTFVRQAYSSIGIINQNDDLTDSEYQDGLDYLNQILAKDQANGNCIPYFVKYVLNTVAGQTDYVIAQSDSADVEANPLVDLEMAQLIYNNAQINLNVKNRSEFYTTSRSLNALGQPCELLLTKNVNSSTISFYPVPSSSWAVWIRGKAVLSNITANTAMSNIPPHMLMYLRLALSRQLAMRYKQSVWEELHENEYQDARAIFTAGNEIDVSLDKSPTLGGNRITWPLITTSPT